MLVNPICRVEKSLRQAVQSSFSSNTPRGYTVKRVEPGYYTGTCLVVTEVRLGFSVTVSKEERVVELRVIKPAIVGVLRFRCTPDGIERLPPTSLTPP